MIEETNHEKARRKEEVKYRLISSIPFQVLALLFVISCIASDYYYRQESIIPQYLIWGTFVSIVVGFLIYIRVKNK